MTIEILGKWTLSDTRYSPACISKVVYRKAGASGGMDAASSDTVLKVGQLPTKQMPFEVMKPPLNFRWCDGIWIRISARVT